MVLGKKYGFKIGANKCALFALLVCITSNYCINSNAQELKGHIVDEHKKPIYRAHIQLMRDGKLRNRAFTDWQGKYHIWPIERGGYQALVSVEGYDRIVRDINLKTMDTTFIDFTLHKKSTILSK